MDTHPSPTTGNGQPSTAGGLRVVLIYAICATLWILFSDTLLAYVINDPQTIVLASVIKGWAFVAITSLLLFVLLRKLHRLHAQVTKQQQLAEELHLQQIIEQQSDARDALSRYHANLIEQARDIVLLTDAEGCITEANQSAFAAYGWGADELLGMNMSKLYPAEANASFAAWWQAATHPQGVLFETMHQRRDGSMFPVEVSSRVIEIGGKHHLQSFIRDISERKQAEKALRDSEAKAHLLLESTAEAIYGTDLHGNCSFVNPACLRLLGYVNDDELLGRHIHEIIHHTRVDNSPYPAQECRAFGVFRSKAGVHVDDEVYWRKDGTSIPVEYWAHPIRKASEVIGLVVTWFDISERKAAEASLKQQSEELQRRLDELERFNRAVVGRELDMIELKRQINDLSRELGRAAPFPLNFIAADAAAAKVTKP